MRPDGKQTGLAESFSYAFEGVREASRTRNFRIMAAVGLLAIILGIALRISAVEWVVVIFCIGAVLASETANTALENLVDLSVSTYSEQAKRAKDLGAAASLILSLASLLIGIIIFLPRIIGLVS